MGAERRESERANVHHAHVRWTVAALARRQSMPSNRRQRKGGAHLKSGSPIARLEPHILNTAERSKGAAGFRCRQLDGRAAILMVVCETRGGELAGSVCGSSARWPFTCLEAIPPVVGYGRPQHASRGCAKLVTLHACHCASRAGNKRIAPISQALMPQLTDGPSSWLRPGGEMLMRMPFVLLIACLLGVLGLDESAISCTYFFWLA